MKKVLVLLLAAMMLVGCGGKGKGGDESATCTLKQDGVMSMDMTVTATDDEIHAMKMVITVDKDAFGGIDVAALDDATKKQIEDMMLSGFGISADQAGLKVSIDYTDTMVITLDIDFEKADAAILESMGLDIDNADMSFKRFVEDAEKEGATCK